jgi:hypothetical protein
MKMFTRILMFMFIWALSAFHTHAQCPLAGTLYGTAAAPTTCAVAFASPNCHYTSSSAGDYASFTALVAGSTYRIVTSSSSASTVANTDELTLYLSTNTTTGSHVAYGTGGVITFTPAVSGTYFLVINKSGSACGTAESVCRYPSIQCTSCSAAGTPLCTTNSAPANNATGVSLTPTLSWATATNASTYDIYLGTSVAGATLLGTTTSTSVLITAGANLQPLTQYFWYIVPKACDGTGPADCTPNATSFTTQGPPPANNECAGAVTLTPQAFQLSGCPSAVSGTTVDATQTTTPTSTNFASSSDDDVWYTFTATTTSHYIRFCNVTYPVGAAVSMGIELHPDCSGAAITGPTVTITSGTGQAVLSSLTIGANYKMRVLTSGTTSRANFDISVLEPPAAPANDNCAGATAFSTSPNAACVYTQVSTIGATQTTPNPSCTTTGNNDDVWFTVTPTVSGVHTLRYQTLTAFTGTASTVGVTFYTGSCASLTEVGTCNTGFGSAGTGTLSTPTFTAGTTYYMRMWVGAASNSGTWDLCIEQPAPMTYVSSAVTQSNVSNVTQGTSNNQIIGVTVTVIGAASALSVTNFDLNSVGSTAPAGDISAARVFYTGTSSTFAATNQFGSTLTSGFASPFSITGSQVLTGGATNTVNYFWVVYDISCAATVSNTVDGECTSVTIGGTPQTPSPTTVSGSRTIIASAGGFDTKQNGDWNDPNTWLCGSTPPTATTVVNINHNVTVSTGSVVSGSLTIATGKTLTINGGTLTVGSSSTGGATGNSNRTVTVNGTLTISSGQMDVNGSMTLATAGFFNMSGGTLNFDPNDGTSAGSATGATLTLNNGTNGTVNGGTINFIDPPYASSARSLAFSHASQDAVWGTGCTVNIGGGDDTNASNTAGFYIECNVSTGTLEIGTMIVSSGRNNNGATNVYRAMTTNTSASFITKIRNLTVDAGSEVVVRGAPLVITGANLINNGFITVVSSTAHRGLVFAGDAQYVSTVNFTNSSIAQTWSGGGFFKKATADADPTMSDQNQVTSFAFYNGGSASALTMGSPLSCTNLHCGAGVLISSASNPIIIGTGTGTSGNVTVAAATSSTATTVTLPLSAVWTGGWVSGPVQRWYKAAITSGSEALLPTGSSVSHQIATISFTTAPATAGKLSAEFFGGAPDGGSDITPALTQGALSITTVSPSGSWVIEPTATNGVSPNTYSTNLYSNGFTKVGGASITLPAETVLLKRSSSSNSNTDYILNGTHQTSVTAGTGIIRLQRSVMSGFSRFAMGGTSAALPLELTSFLGKVLERSNMIQWETARERNVAIHIVERSADGANWTEIGRKAGQNDSNVSVKYEVEDRTPLFKAYYRLRSVDTDGAESLSNTIVLTRKNEVFGITNVMPNPTTDRVTVQFAVQNESSITIRITDINGRIVLEQQMEPVAGINEVPVYLNRLQSGVYNIAINDGTQTSTPVRVVKQ